MTVMDFKLEVRSRYTDYVLVWQLVIRYSVGGYVVIIIKHAINWLYYWGLKDYFDYYPF
jgi:hypothetical protein